LPGPDSAHNTGPELRPAEDLAQPPQPGDVPAHDAQRIIALRVRSAEATPTHLVVETAVGSRKLPWNQLEFISLGIIDGTVGMGDIPRSGIAKTIRKLFSGEGPDEPMVEPRAVRREYLLDIYLVGHQGAYRIDGSHFNYRSILGQVGYISMENFRHLVEILLAHCPLSRVDCNLAAFARNRRDDLKAVGAVYDFEQEALAQRRKLEEMALAGECGPGVENCPPPAAGVEGIMPPDESPRLETPGEES